MGSVTLTQKVCLVLGVVLLAHAVGGLVVNPDFKVGSNVTSEEWLLMDWNGWHALSGILLWSAAIFAAFRADYARFFSLAVVLGTFPVVVWMIFDPRPFGVFLLPTTTDLVFHSAIVATFAGLFLFDRPRQVVTAPV